MTTHPILEVADSESFAPKAQTLNFDRAFEPQHWGVVEAMVLDPDGREVSLQAPLPANASASDAKAHHADKYGTK